MNLLYIYLSYPLVTLLSTSVTSTRYNIVPGWNEYVKKHHSHAKDAQWRWKLNNKLRHGHIYSNIKVTLVYFISFKICEKPGRDG